MKTRTHKSEVGFTLTEVLVATAIFTIIVLAGLLMYDRGNRVFKTGVEAANQQQNTRVAFDRLVTDLRMAGFDFDRDGIPTGASAPVWQAGTVYSAGDLVVPTSATGDVYEATVGGTSGASEPTWDPNGITTDNGVEWRRWAGGGANQYQQPDEQIEYAGRTAITIRGNLNYETASDPCVATATTPCDNGREPAYESGQFPVVTTANNEIVTYALVSANAASNTDSITFFADTAMPRDVFPGNPAEDTVTIDGVDLSNANPPYTLMRITLNDDGEIERVPLANNIRSIQFTYYEDTTGTTPLRDLAIPPNDIADGGAIGGAGAYDPNNATVLVPERNIRAKIRSVAVRLVGMNEQPDPLYTDADETVASAANFRKYMLESLVVPRNAGKRGLREQDTTPPGVPKILSACAGYCGYVYLRWTAPSSGGAVDNYIIKYDTNINGSYGAQVPMSQLTEGAISGLDSSKVYFFKVTAINSYGSEDSAPFPSTAPGIAALNRRKPLVGPVTASTDVPNQVNLTWNMVREQSPDNAITCIADTGTATAPSGLPAPEIDGYNVYRATAEAGPYSLIAEWNDADYTRRPLINTATYEVTFTDYTAANCVPYYYKVQAVERCSLNAAANENDDVTLGSSDESASALGQTPTSSLTPAAPSDLAVTSLGTDGAGNHLVRLTWPTVRADNSSPATPLAIDAYQIRWTATSAAQTETDSMISSGHTDVTRITSDTQSYDLAVAMNDSSGLEFTYRFTIVAMNCGVAGDPSPERIFPCDFTTGYTISASSAIDGDGSELNPWLVDVPLELFVNSTAPLETVRMLLWQGGVQLLDDSEDGPDTVFEFELPDAIEGAYRADFVLTDAAGCVKTESRYFETAVSGCCIKAATDNADPDVVRWSSGNNFVEFNVQNLCDDPLPIMSGGVHIKWDPTVFSGSGQTRLTSINYTLADGTTATDTVPNPRNTDNPLIRDPVTPVTTLPGGESMRVRVTFNKTSGSAFSPVTGFCLKYLRPGIDDAVSGATCQFYPQPSTIDNSCNP